MDKVSVVLWLSNKVVKFLRVYTGVDGAQEQFEELLLDGMRVVEEKDATGVFTSGILGEEIVVKALIYSSTTS